MKVDPIRIKNYLSEIRRNSIALQELLDQNEIVPDSVPLKAAKYILIELAEAMSNTIQHILAKEKGASVSVYIDAVVKARENGIITDDLFQRLKPFFDFRNIPFDRIFDILLLVVNVFINFQNTISCACILVIRNPNRTRIYDF